MNRGEFLAASGMLAASGPVAQGVPGGEHFVARRADFDAAAFAARVGRPAQIRQVYQTVAFRPGILGNIRNAFNGLQFGFGYPPDAIVVVLAGHGPSAAYGYRDEIWQRYRIGEFFKIIDASGAPIASNIFLPARAPADAHANPDDEAGMYQDASIQMLQRRGLVVLTCHTAVEEQARALCKGGFAPASMTPSEVADDILTHLIPGAVVVPSMVAAIAVLQQRYGYAYLAPTL
jgi:intracellular sulfur oxidation DsrE/DsrF family protein